MLYPQKSMVQEAPAATFPYIIVLLYTIFYCLAPRRRQGNRFEKKYEK